MQNKRKVKKRARRNATLGTYTILSGQEGQSQIQQLDSQAIGRLKNLHLGLTNGLPNAAVIVALLGILYRFALINSYILILL